MIERALLMDLRAEIMKIAREEVKKAIEEQIEPKQDESGSVSCVYAVPVVRCKDCKWWYAETGECYGNGNMGYGVGRKADDFCSWGSVKMDDLISRQAAIDAVKNALLAWSYMSSWREAKIVETVADLPSAQPSATDINVATTDTISRQAAIDALMEKDKKLRNINWYDKPYAEAKCKGIDEALSIISNLPSAQPEPYKEEP